MTSIALSTSVVTSPLHAQTPPAAEREAPAAPPIDIRAEESDYDLRAGVTRFERNVTITRGAMEVQSDRGTVRQAQGQITEVELEGSPSTWRDRLDDGSIVSGEAVNIHFDVLANIVTLTGNAIIRHEQGEFTGDELVYDLTAENLAGRSTGDERVRVIIQPEAMSDPITPPPSESPTTETDPAVRAADAVPADDAPTPEIAGAGPEVDSDGAPEDDLERDSEEDDDAADESEPPPATR